MPDASTSKPVQQGKSLAPIWVALALAVVIAALSLNERQRLKELIRWQETGVYPTELTAWTRLRFSLGMFWARFWWLLGPFILCAFPGAAALYRMVRFDSSKNVDGP